MFSGISKINRFSSAGKAFVSPQGQSLYSPKSPPNMSINLPVKSYKRFFEGMGFETLFELIKTGKKGDFVLPVKETFWLNVPPNLKTGQTWKEIGPDLIRLGLNNSIKFGSEGRSISDMIELHPEAYIPAGIYQNIFESAKVMAEMKGVVFEKDNIEITKYEKENGCFNIKLSNGKTITSEDYFSNIGPGKERNSVLFDQTTSEGKIKFLSGDQAIQSQNWQEPSGNLIVIGLGPTSLWVVEHTLLNLGYAYDPKGDWTWRGEGWEQKPDTEIKLLADPKYDSPEKIKELENTPRLTNILRAINKGLIPVEIILGKTDIKSIPKIGDAIKYTDENGLQKTISDIGLVVSAIGQEFDQLYLSQPESYWKGSKIMLGSHLSGPSNEGEQFREIIGIQGPDGRKFGTSTTKALADSCLKYSVDPQLIKMAKEINYNMNFRIYKNGPTGGISHLTHPPQSGL